MRKNRKIIIWLALLVIVVTAALFNTNLISFAWFSSNRQLRTTAAVTTATLDILDKEALPVARVELQTVDNYKQEFQFTVLHSDTPYCIALANTRNVSANDVTFEIYAIKDNSRIPVSLKLLNPSTAKNDPYYTETFDDEDLVQKDAVPLYRISDPIEVHNTGVDSYVLEVLWKNGIDHFDSSKETDMLYLFAQMILN